MRTEPLRFIGISVSQLKTDLNRVIINSKHFFCILFSDDDSRYIVVVVKLLHAHAYRGIYIVSRADPLPTQGKGKGSLVKLA